jgi:hypothetical protein
MPTHRFRVGDRVRIVASDDTSLVETFIDRVESSHTDKSQEVWEIVRLLPPDESGFQYHIKGGRDGLTRLVHERQLKPVG